MSLRHPVPRNMTYATTKRYHISLHTCYFVDLIYHLPFALQGDVSYTTTKRYFIYHYQEIPRITPHLLLCGSDLPLTICSTGRCISTDLSYTTTKRYHVSLEPRYYLKLIYHLPFAIQGDIPLEKIKYATANTYHVSLHTRYYLKLIYHQHSHYREIYHFRRLNIPLPKDTTCYSILVII